MRKYWEAIYFPSTLLIFFTPTLEDTESIILSSRCIFENYSAFDFLEYKYQYYVVDSAPIPRFDFIIFYFKSLV